MAVPDLSSDGVAGVSDRRRSAVIEVSSAGRQGFAARRSTSRGTTGSRADGPRVMACSRISGRSTDGSTVSSHATASATSAARIAYISNATSCSMSVSTGPGVTMWTLIPSRSTSWANASANAFMPAFDAEYAVRAHRLVCGRRRDEHEPRAGFHPWQSGRCDDETRIQIRRHRRAPLLESLLARIGSAEYPRSVDDKVDLGCRLHRRLELLRFGRIGYYIARAHLFGCGPQRFLTSCGEDDIVAELDQRAAAGLYD